MAEKNEIEKKNITVFGEETEFDGVLEFSDRLVITGKFSGSLVGGATINYSDMKSEGNSEWDKCMEELKEKWSDPPPIDVC